MAATEAVTSVAATTRMEVIGATSRDRAKGMWQFYRRLNKPRVLPVRGRLRFFVDFWQTISKDPWIIQSVSEGVKINFLSPPFQAHSQSNMHMGKIQSDICDQEVRSLLEKGAIELIEPGEGFVSGLFVIPKLSGGSRPIVNLKALNKFVRPVHFKMEGIPLLQELIRPGIILLKLTLRIHTSPSLYARRIGNLWR